MNLKDVIKTILNKKFKISIREDYYSYNFNKSDYLAPYFQYVRKFKNHSFLKIIITGNLFKNQTLFKSYFHFFNDNEITEIVREMLETTNDSYLELQIKTLYFLAKTKYIPEQVELKA